MLSYFLLGFMTGLMSGLISISAYVIHRIIKKGKQQTMQPELPIADQQKADPIYEEQVTKRLEEVKKISERQYDLLAQIKLPSMNSMHSKHKNTLVQEIKILEDEKYTLLSSILKDGHDPVLVMQDPHTGEVKQEKLSSFISDMPQGKEKPKGRQRGKFTVYDNDDFDRDDDGGNNTIH